MSAVQPPDLPDSCTAEQAADLVASAARDLPSSVDVPTVRTIRLWRSKGYLTHDDRNLSRRNLLEILAIMRMRLDGMSPSAAGAKVMTLDEERLRLLLGGAPPAAPADQAAFAVVTLQLLCRGLLQQYAIVAHGGAVGVSDPRRRMSDNPPASLRQAMARLGRLAFEAGVEDATASLHLLIARCTTPLGSWAPGALATLSEYADAVLVDPGYLVPSEDCQVIAEQAEGGALEDMLEHRIHAELTGALGRLGPDADAAYTIVREFVGRNPMASTHEIRSLFGNPELTDEVLKFVDSIYEPVHASFAMADQVNRCAECRALVRPDGRCVLSGCRDDHPVTRTGDPIRLKDARLARPEVLKYWADPAREEIRLYDGLRKAKLDIHLYPHGDRCDVSVGQDLGIDVKDYRDPVRLARRLNRSLGGLAMYPRAILAVADRRAIGTAYIERLREQMAKDVAGRLEVMSVKDTLRLLRREGRETRHARAS